MYTIPPKKMVTINILNVLKKYSDINHRLKQKDIIERLKEDYSMTVDRKTVKRNLMNIMDMDCGLAFNETVKIVKAKKPGDKDEEVSVYTDWYIEREFDDSEIRLLIDSILFSKNIPQRQCKELIDKLTGLSNVYFNQKVKHISNLPENRLENKELFYTIDTIEEAISQNKKVAFTYNSYGADKKLHPRRNEEYVVSPYQMVATNGRYYMICHHERYDDISNFRIDRITGIRMLNDVRKSAKKAGYENVNLPQHMAEHLYMFSGASERVKFRAKNYLIDQIIDWFGADVSIKEENGEECLIEVVVNKEAFFCWAMQYGLHIEVLEPVDMRERVIAAVKKIGERYGVK